MANVFEKLGLNSFVRWRNAWLAYAFIAMVTTVWTWHLDLAWIAVVNAACASFGIVCAAYAQSKIGEQRRGDKGENETVTIDVT